MRYILLVLCLSGCVSAPQPFDNNLYNYYVDASVLNKYTMESCGSERDVILNSKIISYYLDEASVYAKYRNEKPLSKATELLNLNLTQLNKIYTKSAQKGLTVSKQEETYCQLKLEVVSIGLDHILNAIGDKP